jgi:hypothetical protein
MKNEIAAENNRLGGLLEVQKLEAQQMQFRLSQQEKLMEERRLATEQQVEMIRLKMDATQRFAQQSPIMIQTDKPMVVEKAPTRSKKRKGTIISDSEGNPVGIDIEEID